MRTALILAGIIGIAVGQGYYHQEYNYKTSSSSYKNNELQHKTDDQGYYSKAGDLEGRVRPKVKSNSEHSEYVNPKLGQGGSGYYDANTDLTSHGNLQANTYGANAGSQLASGYQAGSSYYGNALESEGLASSNYVGGYSGSAAYNAQAGGAYQTASSLRSVGSRLQNDLHQELQEAVRQSHLTDINVLEDELRRNLTARLHNILQERYGTQTIKSGLSYSLSDGRLQASPNYEQQELDQLQRQIERTLMDELRQQYNYRTSQSSQQTYNQRNYERYESTTTVRPYIYKPVYPNLNTNPVEVNYPGYGGAKDSQYQYASSSNSQQRVSSNTEYVQAPNVVSITTIASNVQRDLNNRLNQILENAQNQYFTESERFGNANTGTILEQLKQDLRQNLTYTLEEELRRHFGTQFERNGYMLSSGQTNQYNYNVADLENLRRQVEQNLITKLNRDFETARQHWVTRQKHVSAQSQQTSYGQTNDFDYIYNRPSASNQRYEYSTPRYVDDYYRPTAASIVPLIGAGIKGGQQYQSGSSHLNAYQSSASSNMVQLQNQLQAELSNQLKAALSQNRAHLGQYSTDSGQTGFNEAYSRLYDELKRNLTSQLESFTAGSSDYSNTYGVVNSNQLAQLRSQLQNNLASQLQQGLQQSYSASASYSASSGSSASAGSGAYSSSNSGRYYRSIALTQPCPVNQQHSQHKRVYKPQCPDFLLPLQNRKKRSYGYRSRPLGLATNTGVGYGGRDGGYASSNYGSGYHIGQQVDETELSQPNYNSPASSNYHQVGQEIDDTDETQQVVDPMLEEVRPQQSSSAYSNFGAQTGQEVDDSDTQQVEVDAYLDQMRGQQFFPTYPSSGAHTGQVVDDSDTQQVQVDPNIDWVGQVQDNSDDTQQVEVDSGFNGLSLGSNLKTTSTTPRSYSYSSRPIGGYGYHNSQTISGTNPNSRPTDNVQYLENNQNTGSGHQVTEPESKSVVDNQSGSRTPTSSGGSQYFRGEDNSQYLENTQTHRGYNQNLYGNQRRPTPNGQQRPLNQVTNSLTGQVTDDFEDVPFQVGSQPDRTNHLSESSAGQVVDDSEITQQVEDDGFAPLNTGSQLKPSVDDERDISVTDNKPSRHRSNPRLPSSNKIDVANTNEEFLHKGEDTYYDIGEAAYLPPLTNPENDPLRSNPRLPSSNKINVADTNEEFLHKGEDTYYDIGETRYVPPLINPENDPLRGDIKPVSQVGQKQDNLDTIKPLSTTVKPLLLNYATQNSIPESESVQPLSNSFGFNQLSTTTVSTHPIQRKPYDYRPFSNIPQPEVTAVYIPPQLKPLSVQIEASLLQNLEETLLSEITALNNPSQAYQQTLYTLKENITRECQKLLSETQFLNVNQRDVFQLQTYLETHLVQTLNQKFVFSASGEVVAFKPVVGQPSLVNSYRPKFEVNSNAFIQSESQYHGGYQSPQYVYKPFQSESFVTPQAPSQTRPTLKPSYSEAEIEADQLLEGLRNTLQSRPTTPRSNQQPEYQVIQVKLENITPQQFSIINQIEQEFTSVLDTAVQTEFASTSYDHASRYELYQSSLNKLEQELKRNLTECIEGILRQDSELQYLNKYSSQVYANFDYQKINDVKKYIEIKLIKKLRAQLKLKYNIDNSVSSQSEFVNTGVSQVSPQAPRSVVRLENLTPEQARVIKNIEDDINKQIKSAIETYITNLRSKQVSEYFFQSSLETLEEELKNNITSSVQSLCEPGFGQYPELQASNFDMSKINDLEKYLQIRLVGKLRETIKYYSTTFLSSTSYQSSSRHHFSHSYQQHGGYGTVPDNREVDLFQPGQPLEPVVPMVPPPSRGSVKGGRPQSAYRETSPQLQGTNPNAIGEADLGSSTVDSEIVEPVTESQSWWSKFGNKVKQGANKIRDKITGKKTEPSTE